MPKLLLISDNHGNISILNKILKAENYDYAIHLGDSELSLEYMNKNFNYFVRGNHDYYDPITETFSIDNLNILIAHGHMGGIEPYNLNGKLSKAVALAKKNEANIAIFGHTHIPLFEKEEDITIINPGSCALPRNPEGATYAILTIDGKNINVEHKLVKNLIG